MRLHVLGSAAGGGFPQWNCGCRNCQLARSGSARTRSRTQESVALSADDETYFLLNASPEIRAQLESFAKLHPRAPRHSPVAAIVLTNGDLDHCLGLLSLRESHPLHLYATDAMRKGFSDGNSLYRTLQRFDSQVTWHELRIGECTPLLRTDGTPSGLEIEPIAVPGKLPVHLEATHTPSAEDNIGLLIREPVRKRCVAYVSGIARDVPGLEETLSAADCVFLDGTFWSSDELGTTGVGTKKAEDMAHWPIGGPEGSLEFLTRLRARNPSARRILIHINNTNPILIEDSQEALAIRGAGVEIAYDGLEVTL